MVADTGPIRKSRALDDKARRKQWDTNRRKSLGQTEEKVRRLELPVPLCVEKGSTSVDHLVNKGVGYCIIKSAVPERLLKRLKKHALALAGDFNPVFNDGLPFFLWDHPDSPQEFKEHLKTGKRPGRYLETAQVPWTGDKTRTILSVATNLKERSRSDAKKEMWCAWRKDMEKVRKRVEKVLKKTDLPQACNKAIFHELSNASIIRSKPRITGERRAKRQCPHEDINRYVADLTAKQTVNRV